MHDFQNIAMYVKNAVFDLMFCACSPLIDIFSDIFTFLFLQHEINMISHLFWGGWNSMYGKMYMYCPMPESEDFVIFGWLWLVTNEMHDVRYVENYEGIMYEWFC